MDSNELLKRNQKFVEDISHMLIRWKAGSMVKHLDVELFERLVHEVFELDRHLVIAMNTIEVLSVKANENDIILRNFSEEDRIFLRRRIQARLDRAERERSGEEGKEVPEVRSN